MKNLKTAVVFTLAMTFVGLASANASSFEGQIQKIVKSKGLTTKEVATIGAAMDQLITDVNTRTSDKTLCLELRVLALDSNIVSRTAELGDNSEAADYEWSQAKKNGDSAYRGRRSESSVANALRTVEVQANAMKYGFCDGSETTEVMFGEIRTVKKGDRAGLRRMLNETGKELVRELSK